MLLQRLQALTCHGKRFFTLRDCSRRLAVTSGRCEAVRCACAVSSGTERANLRRERLNGLRALLSNF